MKLAQLYEGLEDPSRASIRGDGPKSNKEPVIKVSPKVRAKPKGKPTELKINTRELSDEEKTLRKKAAELRAKIAKRDPTLVTTTRLRPTGYET